MILRRYVFIASATLAVAASVGVAVAPSASAASVTNRHDGIVVTTPKTRSVTGSKKATVAAAAHIRSGAKRAIKSKTITAYRSGEKVGSGTSIRLRAGTYRVKTSVAYRRYKMVTKTHKFAVHYPEDLFPNGARCVVKQVDTDLDDLFIDKSDCTLRSRPGQIAHDTDTVTDTPGPYHVGQVVYSDYVDFPAYTGTKTVRGPVRVYGQVKHYTTPRHTLVVKKKQASGGGSGGGGASSGASCYPLTNGGNCYEPGEYCRNSDHGASGVAGNGEAIVCEDNNGWRWEPA